MAGNGTVGFDYVRPKDWREATRLLAEPGAAAKMGGCEVLMRLRAGRLKAQLLVGLNDLPGVDELSFSSGGARIGAAVTLAQLSASPEFVRRWPIIAQVMGRVASPAIRGAATVVGNIAQGWGVGDLVPLFVVCDAQLEIYSSSGQRTVSVAEYAKTPGTGALAKGEIISALLLKIPNVESRLAYERFSFKNAFDLPLVSVAIAGLMKGNHCNDVRIAAVGAGRMPSRSEAAEDIIKGRNLESELIEKAGLAIGRWANPPNDFRASSEYRRHLLITMLRRALPKLTAA